MSVDDSDPLLLADVTVDDRSAHELQLVLTFSSPEKTVRTGVRIPRAFPQSNISKTLRTLADQVDNAHRLPAWPKDGEPSNG